MRLQSSSRPHAIACTARTGAYTADIIIIRMVTDRYIEISVAFAGGCRQYPLMLSDDTDRGYHVFTVDDRYMYTYVRLITLHYSLRLLNVRATHFSRWISRVFQVVRFRFIGALRLG